MKTNPNDKALATYQVKYNEIIEGLWGGLTKREQFAAMAMQSLLSINDGNVPKEGAMTGWNYEIIALCSIRAADALIKELNIGQP